jgi:sugar O-acyltransferase (sialic acid O-acetyltransferase NeuD family)
MTQRRSLIVVGAGRFAQEVIWAARNSNAVHPDYDILGYCDDDPAKKGDVFYGYPVLGTPEEVDKTLSVKPCFVCAIGENQDRARVVQRVLALDWIPATIIDPSVIVAEGVVVGDGTYVGAGSILSPYANIGNHVIINHHCSIGHYSILEDFVQVSPGGRVSGGSILREGASLGSNAVVAPRRTVGRYATLSACSFAMTNIPDNALAVGIPARVAAVGVQPCGNMRRE